MMSEVYGNGLSLLLVLVWGPVEFLWVGVVKVYVCN